MSSSRCYGLDFAEFLWLSNLVYLVLKEASSKWRVDMNLAICHKHLEHAKAELAASEY